MNTCKHDMGRQFGWNVIYGDKLPGPINHADMKSLATSPPEGINTVTSAPDSASPARPKEQHDKTNSNEFGRTTVCMDGQLRLSNKSGQIWDIRA